MSRSYDPNYLSRRALDETNIFRGSERMPPLCPIRKSCSRLQTSHGVHAIVILSGLWQTLDGNDHP